LASWPAQSDPKGETVQITRDESNHVLKIAGTLEIGVAEELHRTLRDFVSEESSPAVNLSEVDGCDTAALQLLCSARKPAEQFGKPFRLAGLSAAVRNASEALGLSLPDVTPDDSIKTPADTIGAATEGDRDAI
jgi:anti-anti-sigma factor